MNCATAFTSADLELTSYNVGVVSGFTIDIFFDTVLNPGDGIFITFSNPYGAADPTYGPFSAIVGGDCGVNLYYNFIE